METKNNDRKKSKKEVIRELQESTHQNEELKASGIKSEQMAEALNG